MPALSDYVTGTISLTNGSVDFTGTSTGWLLAGFKEGDTIIDITGATEYMGVIATIDANGAGTLTKAWEGPTLVDVAYRMRYQPDGARVSAQARNLIELLGNGNVLALAGLSGSANQVPMFTGPGAMTLVPKTDLVSGADYDVQAADLAARAAYDGQAAGYAVLVADVGDGRAAIYSKVSATSGDWSDPAYVTGPVGPLPDVTVGTVTTGDPGTAAQVTATPTVDGVELDFTIPAGRGLTPLGDYNPATAYILDDAVLYNGSTWIALQTTTGNAPPTLPTTSNAYWQLLARQGIDGAGTVNSVAAGTGIAVDNTDPTAPVVSAPYAVRFNEAQVLTEAEKGQARANIGVDVLAGFRNKIINGGFDIWQRGTSTGPATASVLFGPDRWTAYQTGNSVSWSRLAFGPGTTDVPGNPEFYAAVAIASGGANTSIGQKIENVRTLAGKRITITGYVSSNAAPTFNVALRQNFGSGGDATVVTNAIVGQTAPSGSWTKFQAVLDVPSISGKTLGAGNFLGLYLESFSVTGFTLYLAHISIVEGDASAEDDPFSPRHIQQELALCQRYFWSSYANGVAPGTSGQGSSALSMLAHGTGNYMGFGPITFPTKMRATPTMILYRPSTGVTGVADVDASSAPVVQGQSGPGHFSPYVNNSAVSVAQAVSIHATADAEL